MARAKVTRRAKNLGIEQAEKALWNPQRSRLEVKVPKPATPMRQSRQRRTLPPMPKPEPEPAIKLLLSVERAAVALSIGRKLLYPMLMRGEIRSVTIGRRRLVPVAEIEAYIARLLESA